MSLNTSCEEDISKWFWMNNIVEHPAPPMDYKDVAIVVQTGDLTIIDHDGGIGFKEGVIPTDYNIIIRK